MVQNLLELGLSYPPTTFLTVYKNQTLEWIPSDTQQNYKENCQDPTVKEYIKQWDNKLTYVLNSHGFRTSEIEEDNQSLVALGCSHTFGVGLSDNQVYCRLLADKLGCRLFNLGVPGGATDTAFRIASYWLPIIKPKYVVMVGPQPVRFEIRMFKTDRHVFIPGNTGPEKSVQEMAKRFISFEENALVNRHKNLLAIENITERFGGKFYSYNENMKVVDRARDNLHYGPVSHRNSAENIYNDIMSI
jgi:hypothetical protein